VLLKKATTVFKETHSDPVSEPLNPVLEAAAAPVPTRQPLTGQTKSRPNAEHGPVVIEPIGEILDEEAAPSVAEEDRGIHRAVQETLSDPATKEKFLVKQVRELTADSKYPVLQVEVQEKYEYLDALEEQARVIEQKRNEELAESQALARIDQEEYWDEEEEEEYFDADGYTTARSLRSRGDNTTGGVTLVLAPRITAKSQRELEAAKQYVEANKTQEDVDDEQWDTSMVAEYSDEIFEYMHTLEVSSLKADIDTSTNTIQVRMMPNACYMDHQQEIQWSMRAVLMDWLVQVHNRFT
jgi:hypothetical protein